MTRISCSNWITEPLVKGSNASDILLETFAEKLADSIVKGELYVQNPDSYEISVIPSPSTYWPR